jgi:3-oxoacyl-[acyl-carrier protein] reductase
MTLRGPFQGMFEAPPEGFDNMDPANSSPLFAYLASPAAQNVTAQLFIVWGRQVVVMQRPSHGETFDHDEAWSVEALEARLGPHFEKQQPIVDGYPLPEV